MLTTSRFAFALSILTLTFAFSCGRSDTNPAFTEERAAEVTAASAAATANTASIVELGDAQVAATARVDGAVADIADHETRIVALEAGGAAGGPFNDEVIRIDDQAAAGFVGQGDINNVELGFNNVNARLDSQNAFAAALDGRVTAAQNEQPGLLTSAIENIADARIAAALPVSIQAAIDATVQASVQTAVDAAVQTAVQTLVDDRIVPLESAVANMSGGVILGPSAVTTGDAGGLNGAATLCVTAFPAEPSAHMCTLAEVHHAVSRGNAAVDGVEAWILPSMTAIFAAGAYTGQHYDATASSDQMSCNSMTHAEAAAAATAMGASVEVNGGSVNVLPAKDCSESLPLLCCL